jgi:hypothetical protein
MLDVTIRRCPPATYTIIAEPNSNQLFTFVIFLKQRLQIFVFILNTKKLKLSLPLELQSGTWSEIQLLCASQLESSTDKNMIARTIYHSEKIPFKTCKLKHILFARNIYHMMLYRVHLVRCKIKKKYNCRNSFNIKFKGAKSLPQGITHKYIYV